MRHINILLRPFRVLLILLCKSIAGVIPKDRKLVLFGAWFGQKYADNTKYLFEFCLGRSEVNPVWFTKSKSVFAYLSKQGKPVVYSKTLKGLFTQMRARMLVSTVDYGDFNYYFISNCIIFDQGHGVAIKHSHDFGYESKYQMFFDRLIHINVERYACATNPSLVEMVQDEVMIPNDHIVYANMARTDALFDDNIYDKRNDFLNSIINNRIVIVYAPTHRMQGKIAVRVEELFDLSEIQKLCERFNAVFIIKKHFYHRTEKTELERFDRIFDITNEDIETQSLLCMTDILISDYSAIYIDFLATDRPIILYPYDYEEFCSSIRGLFLRMEDNPVGYKAKNQKELSECLENVLIDPNDTMHAEGRDYLRKRYYNPGQPLGNSREYLYSIMLQLMKK